MLFLSLLKKPNRFIALLLLCSCGFIGLWTAQAQEVVVDSTFMWEAFTPLPSSHQTPIFIDAHHEESYFTTDPATAAAMVRILERDGFDVQFVRTPLLEALDDPSGILVVPALRSIKEQLGSGDASEVLSLSPLSMEEAVGIAKWVYEGGSLLFFTSHYPHAKGAAPLLDVFDVKLRDAFAHTKGVSGDAEDSPCTWYTLQTETGDINLEHATMQELPAELQINTVRWLCGTALIRNPEDVIVALPDSSYSLTLNTKGTEIIAAEQSDQYAAVIGFQFGKGRVVVSGDQGLFRNLLIVREDRNDYITINDPDADNAAFLVVLTRWLANLSHPE